jgi:hypothetical protein
MIGFGSIGRNYSKAHRSKHKSRHWVAPYAAFVMVIMDQEDRVGGECTTCASNASSLNLRRANARRPLTHSRP